MWFTLDSADFVAIFLTLKLAVVVTLILLVICLPVAWWLASGRSKLRVIVNTLLTMPLVLPPTVIGFYLLVLLGPNGPLGQLMEYVGLQTLPFTFQGLVVASCVYSIPFVLQPIRTAMEALPLRSLQLAATMNTGPVARFFYVVLPSVKPGLIAAAVLGFAHTLGEFGIVLMIGGNIPGETQLISMRIYEHVETLSYANAHALSLILLLFSFAVILVFSLFSRTGFVFSQHSTSRL